MQNSAESDEVVKSYPISKFLALDPRKRYRLCADRLLQAVRVREPGSRLDEALFAFLLYYGWMKPAELTGLPSFVSVRDQLWSDPCTREWRERIDRILQELSSRAGQPLGEWEGFVPQGDRPTAERDPFPAKLVLVDIRSPFNVGSLLRCAEAAGCETLHLAGYTPGLEHPKVRRASMGSETHLQVLRDEDPLLLMDRLEAWGITPVGVELTTSSIDCRQASFPFPVALFLGNEELGLPHTVLSRCSMLVQIPLFGAKNSLNVSQAGAIVLFEARRRYESLRQEMAVQAG